MSSILRALKKLENDPRHLEENQPLGSKFVPLADIAPQKSRPHIILISVGGGIICGLIFFSGWWLFSEKNEPSSVPLPEIAQQVSIPRQSPPALTEELRPPGAAAPEKSENLPTDSALVRVTAAPVPEPGPLSLPEPAFLTVEQEEIEQLQETAQKAVVLGQETASKNSSGKAASPVENVSSAAAAGMPQAGIQSKKIEIPQLNDPDMKLQAITWSREPHKRITVINNRILHEGETVSGYLLVSINQDDVVLGREEKTWKLLFRIK